MMTDSTTKKERQWTYIIFFLIGILSFPLSLFLGAILASANILVLEGLFQLLFPVVICSILFAILLYIYKERSTTFALQVFVISLVTSISIFTIGIFLFPLYIFPLILLLILSALGLFIFKDRPLLSFAVKAFTISFFAVFLIVVGWFMLGAYEHESGAAISIKKFDEPKGKYSELTADELKVYPALEKALRGDGCTKFTQDSWYCKVDRDEWKRTSDFIYQKQLAVSASIFKINEKYYEIGFMTP